MSSYSTGGLLWLLRTTYFLANKLGQDPIDAIPSFQKRKEYIARLLSFSEKLAQKEVSHLKKHKSQLQYFLSLYEIIEATDNRTNFEYFRKGYLEEAPDDMEYIDHDLKKQLQGFCLGFRPCEEFFNQERADREERERKLKMYALDKGKETLVSYVPGMNAGQQSLPPKSSEKDKDDTALPSTGNKVDNNKYSMDYSGSITISKQPNIFMNSYKQADPSTVTVVSADSPSETPISGGLNKENHPPSSLYDLEPSSTLVAEKPYGDQQEISTIREKIKDTDFDRLY